MYDYYLGGSNYELVDQVAAQQIAAIAPDIADTAWANRGFHQRATLWLATRAGIDQFIDIGAGLPTQNNTHDVVLAAEPGARVVYVDNDPAVVLHARQLVSGVPNTDVAEGDLRDPDGLLGHPNLCALIDFDRPVGLLATGLLHFVSDDHDPWGLIARLLEAVCAGSYLALSHATDDKGVPETSARARRIYQNASEQLYLRTRSDVERFFDGLEIAPAYSGAEPALDYAGMWGAEDPEAANDESGRWLYAAVARKP